MDIAKLREIARTFQTRLDEQKAALAGENIPWYPYGTLSNLEWLDRLLQGEQGATLVVVQAEHPDWRVRAQVARSLAHIGGATELPLLTRMMTDAQWWVRYRAAQALLGLPGMSGELLLDCAQSTQDRYALSMAQAVLAEAGEGA